MTRKQNSPALEQMTPVRRTSLSDEIVGQIIDLISRDVLNPGDRLPPERSLCKQFGVGRTSLREALRTLSVMGILEPRVGEGTFVSDNTSRYLEKSLSWGLLLDPKEVTDLVETRLMLESRNAFLAAGRATEADLQELDRTVRGIEGSLDESGEFLEFDVRFHLAIARATQNSILCNLLVMIRNYLQEWIRASLEEPATHTAEVRARMSVEEHGKILRAIRKRDAEAARVAMEEHILSSSVDLRARIDDDSENRSG
ncbi:MAG: FadR/GntR family transcriptional regulator [Gemmatimonadota bacterium]|nr:FadR/GntR family transcriptional regulator [Gemmatimonadota bacterium]